jgi:cytochrome c oxidase assembly factor CtaG
MEGPCTLLLTFPIACSQRHPERVRRLRAAPMFQSLPLAAILTFSDRVIYTRYSSVEDQALAGVIMWVPGSIPLLLPILRVIVELSSARVAMEDRHA